MNMFIKFSRKIRGAAWASSLLLFMGGCGGSGSDTELISNQPIPSAPFEEKIANISISGNNVVFSVEVDTNRFELFSSNHTTGVRTNIADIFSANRPLDSIALNADGNRLAYLADRDNNGTDELYSNLIDGSNETLITDQVETHASGSSAIDRINWQWMPDGNRIVFRADLDGDSILDLHTNLPDGSNLVTISNGLSISCELENCWKIAPDSSVITFRNQTAASQQLHSATPTAALPTQLDDLNDPSAEIESWDIAPDSSLISYVRKNSFEPAELYSVLSNGTQNTLVSPQTNSLGVQDVRWSPDSAQLAFTDDSLTDGMLSLHTSLPDGSNNIAMIDNFVVANPILRNWQWAPDSSRIAYIANQEIANIFELFSVERDGQWHRRLNPQLPAGGLVHPEWQWSPASDFVAFFAELVFPTNYDELFVSSADAAAVNQINIPANTERTIQVTDQHWTPDGSQVIVSLVNADNKIEVLLVANPDGTNIRQLNEGLASGESIAEDFQISPDSTQFLYRKTSSDGITNSLHSTTIASGIRVNLVTLNNVLSAQWTNDSSRVIYRLKSTNEPAEQLYAILPNGNGKLQLY